MSLQTLEWRKLPIVAISTTSSVSDLLKTVNNMLTGSTYFDGSARTVGSGSAWSGSILYTTGSNTEAIRCDPPFKTALSQSVIFVGRSSTGAVSGGTPTMATNENAFATGNLYAALSKNSSNFTNWTGSTPMGVSSSFSGYLLMISSVSNLVSSKVTIYESKEALVVTVGNVSINPATNYAIVAGALIDPQQTVTSSEAESDNRLYSILRSGNTGIDTTFYSSIGGFLDHSASGTSAKYIYFTPQSSTTNTATVLKQTTTATTNQIPNLSSITGKLVKLPIYYTQASTPYSFLGTMRDSYMTRNSVNNLVFRDGSSNIIGFVLSASETSANNALFLSYT